MGKNSNFDFTKTAIRKISGCLTSEIIQDSKLLHDSFSLDIYDKELAEIELTFGTAMKNIPSNNFTFLEEFETTNEPFDDLEIEYVQYITWYLINRFTHKYS